MWGGRGCRFSVVSFKFRRSEEKGTVTQSSQREEHRGHREEKRELTQRRRVGCEEWRNVLMRLGPCVLRVARRGE